MNWLQFTAEERKTMREALKTAVEAIEYQGRMSRARGIDRDVEDSKETARAYRELKKRFREDRPLTSAQEKAMHRAINSAKLPKLFS
jgi:hypothetical protein